MYNLGNQFKVDYDKATSNPECVKAGKNYRFTILTERLIRIEYSENQNFVSEPTTLVINRNFPKPEFTVNEDANYLEISTSYFKLYYTKEKKLNSKNFKVDVLNTDRSWYYKNVEAKNFSVPIRIENGKKKGKIISTKSLYSLDGFVTLDDAKNKIINKDGTLSDNYADIDIYLFVYLNDFAECLKDYFALTGHPGLIPRYALGNWWSKNDDYNDGSLKLLMDNFENNNIPLSVLLLDKDWHVRTYDKTNHLKTGFTFNKELFKAPREMISYLHSKNISVGLNLNPEEGFYNIDDGYQQAVKYLQTDSNGVIPYNVLDPKWIDVYLKVYIHPLDNLGVDFYWIDRPHAFDDYYLKYYQYNDITRDNKRRPMIFGYYNGLAQHRYPVLYPGKSLVSWDSLKQIPRFNADAANLGISWWGHDIGGYYKGMEDNELYTRYVQLGTFSPILKFGADCGKYYKREPWRWNLKTLNIVKDYLQLRHRLIPYLYSEAYRYSQHGVPLIKPLYYKVPEMYDDVLYNSEYYFGSQLFVSPITKSKDYVMDRVAHRFYLPAGIWYDFFTGKKFLGDSKYISFYKDQQYPVFAKAGSIIPMGSNDDINDTSSPKNMEIHFFPGVSNEYLLYEDDGVSDMYKKGYYLLSKIVYDYNPDEYKVTIKALEGKSGIIPEYRNYKIVFRNTKKAEVAVYEGNEKINYKAYVSGSDFIIEINDIRTISQLIITCKGNDLLVDATRIINDEIENILSDLQIETLMKEKVDAVLFSDMPIKKKRIAMRKLGNKGLENKFVKLFLNLLEYVSKI